MIPLRDVFQSATRRFLPGWLLTLAGSLLAFGEIPTRPIQFAFLTLYTFGALSGHVATLSVMRRWLRLDANLVGRKSSVAGAASVGALLIASFLPHHLRDYTVWAAIYFSTSAVVTAAMYLPWITRQPTHVGSSSQFDQSLPAPATFPSAQRAERDTVRDR